MCVCVCVCVCVHGQYQSTIYHAMMHVNKPTRLHSVTMATGKQCALSGILRADNCALHMQSVCVHNTRQRANANCSIFTITTHHKWSQLPLLCVTE